LKDITDAEKVHVDRHWWRKIDKPIEEEPETIQATNKSKAEERKGPRYGGLNFSAKEELKATPALEMLQNSRK